jgi:hypothetical protein
MKPTEENLTSNPIDAPRRSRLSIFRNTGHTAVSEVVETSQVTEDIVDYVEVEPIPFGLTELFTKYQDQWENHQALIEGTLSDIKFASEFQSVILDYAESMIAPQAKKNATAKIGTTGFERVVNLYVASGRLKVTTDAVNFNQSVSGLTNDLKSRVTDLRRIQSKTSGLFNPDRNMKTQLNAKSKIDSRFLELEEQSTKSYKPIYNLEQKIELAFSDVLAKHPESSVKLIETFLQFSDSEIEVEKTFARFLANHYELFGTESVLGYAISSLESLTGSNIFAKDFIKIKIAENNGDNFLSFISTKILSPGSKIDKLMAETFDSWPAEYKQAYKSYMLEKVRDYTTSIQKQVHLTKHKAWLMTDLVSVDEAINRIWLTFYKNYTEQDLRTSPKQQTGRVAQKNKLSIDDVSLDAKDNQNEQLPPKKVIEARRISLNQFETQTGDVSIEEILARQLGSDAQAGRLIKIYKEAIELLSENPFPSKGVSSTANHKGGYIIVDNKRLKIYRANPTQLPGIKAPKELQRGRIIFGTNRDSLIIIAAFASHDEYEKFLVSI